MSELKIVEKLFKGRHFDREVIILCVRWYLRFKVSLRDLVEMMAERGLSMAHTTIMRWVQRYAPEFEKRWRRFARAVRRLWRVEQDPRGVEQRIAVMLGFKEFRNAAITIGGIELLHRIRKGQFGLGRLGVQGQAAPEVWNAGA